MSAVAPKPPADATDDEIARRVIIRARRLADHFDYACPVFVIAREKAILDVAYDEWARRQREAGISTEPDFQE